jgi:FSR family fosmidomycin resistance protein-like MFS transporter
VSPRARTLDRTIFRLAGAHLLTDGYGNIYAPLLPLLIAQLGLSLAAAGTVQMCYQLANSFTQVGFGYLADRWRPRVLLVVGPFIGVGVLSLIGLTTNVWTLGLVLVVGGLGAASFHPPAAALVHQLGGKRQGLAMAVHISGGSLGFSMGPLLFAPFVQWFGLEWTPLLAVPGLLATAALLREIPPVRVHVGSYETAGLRSLVPYARPLTLLYLTVLLRTLTALSFSTFVPVLLTSRGRSLAEAGAIAAAYLFATSAGGFVGGPLADAWGSRKLLIVSLVCSVPFLVAAPGQTGWAFLLLLSVGGFLLQATLPVTVTFAQQLAPVSTATVSSLMMGLAWGVAGVSVPLVGLVADRVGLQATLTAMALLPLLGVMLALALPVSVAVAIPGHITPGSSEGHIAQDHPDVTN